MPRYIDADEFMSKFVNEFWSTEISFSSVDDIVEKLVKKAEDVAPVIHSNWRAEYNPNYSPFDPTMDDEVYFCNNCNNKQYKMSNYCPECGAKMDKRERKNNE